MRLDVEVPMKTVLELARASDSDTRGAALQLLSQSKDPQALPAIEAALKDADADVRAAACVALGERGDPAVVPQLTAALKDTNGDVRHAAASALGELLGR
jgi:HEAT repeat protein